MFNPQTILHASRLWRKLQLSEGFLLYAIVEITMQLLWRCARLGKKV